MGQSNYCQLYSVHRFVVRMYLPAGTAIFWVLFLRRSIGGHSECLLMFYVKS